MTTKPKSLPDRTGLVTTRIKRSGGSLIVTVPAKARDALNLSEGQEMAVNVEDGRLILAPTKHKRPKYTLKELVAQCDFTIPYSDEEKAWINAEPAGREIL